MTETDKTQSLPQRILMALIRGYQLTLSPYIGRQCRFYPTCSHYASEAIATHGALAGSVLTVRRLSRCHPFHGGGVDLVPARDHRDQIHAHPRSKSRLTEYEPDTPDTSGAVSTH